MNFLRWSPSPPKKRVFKCSFIRKGLIKLFPSASWNQHWLRPKLVLQNMPFSLNSSETSHHAGRRQGPPNTHPVWRRSTWVQPLLWATPCSWGPSSQDHSPLCTWRSWKQAHDENTPSVTTSALLWYFPTPLTLSSFRGEISAGSPQFL